MSSEIRYSIEIAFLQKGGLDAPARSISQLHAKSDSWMKSLEGGARNFVSSFNSGLDSIGRGFLNMYTAATAAVSAAAIVKGLKEATTAGFHLNQEMENTRIALASIGKANGTVPTFIDGMRLAEETIKQMRRDAALLPGEFKDLQNIMTTISPAGAESGAGMVKMEKIAAQTMAASAILSVRQDVAAREMAMILEGNARRSLPLFNRLGLGESGAFNKLSAKDRMDKVQQRLDDIVQESLPLFKNSWTGATSTAIDNIRQGLGNVTLPLFTTVKSLLVDFNTWTQNFASANPFLAEDIGIKIRDAFLGGIEVVKHWYPIIAQFTKTMYEGFKGVFERLAPYIKAGFGKLEEFMSDPQAFDKLASIAKTLVGLRIGGAVAGMGVDAMGPIASALASGTISGGAMATAGAGLAVAAAPAAVALIGVARALDILTDKTNSLHEYAVADAAAINDNLLVSLRELETMFLTVEGPLKEFADTLGEVMLTSLKNSTALLRVFMEEASTMLDGARRLITFNFNKKLNEDAPLEKIERSIPPMAWHALSTAVAERGGKGEQSKPPNHTTHIHHVEIKVVANEDPNRIAKKTVDILNDLARHPKVATRSGMPLLSL